MVPLSLKLNSVRLEKSDEYRFSLNADDHRIHVWRLRSERSNIAFVTTVWGAISWGSRSPISRAERYSEYSQAR